MIDLITTATEVAPAASGLTGWLDNILNDAENLVTAFCVIAGIVVGILIISKNPGVGRTISGVVVGAFIAGLPWIIPAVGNLFRGDLEATAQTAQLLNLLFQTYRG